MSKLDKSLILSLLIFFTIFYGLSMSPTIFWQDAGIYSTGIFVEGNVYSPGFPFYMILGIVWKNILPIGDFAQKIQWLSVIFSSVSSVFVYQTIRILLNNKSTLFKNIKALNKHNDVQENMKQEFAALPSAPATNLSVYLLSFITTLMFQLNYNVWAQANNIEVYAFHTLFVSIIIYLTVKIGEKGRIEKLIDPKTIKYIYLLALTYGLSFGNHPMTIILLPTFILLITLQPNILFHKKVLFISTLIFIISGLVTYIYLPVIANTQPILNWGNPNTIERFLTHVSGKTYLTTDQSFVLNDISRYQAAWQEFVWEYSYLGILLAVFGALIIYRQNKTIFSILLSIILFHLFFAVFYKQTTEYNSWLIPAHLATTILIAYSLQYLIEKIKISLVQKKYLISSVSLIPIFIFAIFLVFHTINSASDLDRRQYYYAEDFGKNILKNLDSNSLIFLTGDQESSTILFLQTVKKYRTDVTVIKNIELEQFSTEEGRLLLKKNYPNLILPRIPDSNFNLNTYLNQVILENLGDKSVYLMAKKIVNLDPNKFYITPAAALYKVSLSQQDIDLKYWSFEYHDPKYYLKHERPLMSLKDPSKPGGINRVQFIQHMINYELQSWKNLGDWYIEKNNCDAAQDAYSHFKTIDQDLYQRLSQIQQSLDSCYDKIR